MWMCVFVLHAHMCIKEKHPHGRDLESLSIIDFFFCTWCVSPTAQFWNMLHSFMPFFFFLNQSVININAIQSFVATFWIFIFWLQKCESGFLLMANWKKLLAKLTVFYLNCCREGKRMTDSRLRAKPNLSTFRTFALQGLMFWTLPTLHRTTNAAVTLTWADLSKDNPCFLIDGVKTLLSSNTF